MPSLLTRLARGDQAVLRKISGTTSGTAGTRTTHAHGLQDHQGTAVVPDTVILVAKAANADGALTAGTGELALVSADATSIVVRAGASSVNFDAYVG